VLDESATWSGLLALGCCLKLTVAACPSVSIVPIRLFPVIRSRSPTHVGQRGILIQETQETFVIVSASNAVKVLPKRDTIFSFSLPHASGQPSALPQVFELYGDHLCFRSYERSARKFKAKATIEL
jgi:ribonuclease P protein subunit POP4